MPGIHLYSSNKLEILADTFATLLRSNPLPPLQKETILVQSRGMARWLAMETASRLSIWANCDCPFPNTFIRKIFALLLPDIPDVSAFDKNSILWHLMDILKDAARDPNLRKVASYIESGDDLKRYQLSFEIADLFDQYTLFRPQMILNWEARSEEVPADQTWQMRVWRTLINRLRKCGQLPEHHRARLLQFFEKTIQDQSFDCSRLPPRVSVFGISSLPPYHIRVLAGLARHIDLHFFIMNPCREYWFDIVADRDIVKISRKESVNQEILHLQHGNNLLSSMGNLGKDFMAMLQGLYTEEHELFQEPDNDSLLASIQRDILFLRENNSISLQPPSDKTTVHSSDSSIIFHSCHSPMREIEILHDQLLELFDNSDIDNLVEPRDILVMAPEIDDYAPLIKAVFDADISWSKKIPYSIADQSIRKTSKYIETFLAILLLPQGRCSSIDVLGILEAEAVRNRFNISESDLDVIEEWIRQTNICWGIDQDFKTRLHLPAFGENSWRAGLDRLLLGYAMPGHSRVLFQNILPLDTIEGDSIKVLGNFLDFTQDLFSLVETLQKSHSLTEWSEILLETKNRLMLPDAESAAEDRVLHRVLNNLQEQQKRTFFNSEISLRVIRSFVINSIDAHFSHVSGGTGFLANGVTFCSMLPMRAIPFKVICLLGMNDGMYPRTGRKKSFDLMAGTPKRGDRSRRYDDRYLFLETILSARRKLSISFIGQSIQDGSKRPPSVLVNELMDYIDRGYTFHDNQDYPGISLSSRLTTIHRLQPFHPAYFHRQNNGKQKKLVSYSEENYAAAVTLTSEQHKSDPVFSAPLPTPPDEFRQVDVHELIRFFSHPARYLLTKILNVAPIEENQALPVSEPFTVQGLARYKLESDILEILMKGQDCEKLYLVKKAAGELPHGRMGRVYFTQLVSDLKPFYKILAEILAGHELQQLHVNLEVGGFSITGHLDNVSPIGLVHYRHAAMKATDVIRSWLSHLVFNCRQDSNTSKTGRYTFHVGKKGIHRYTPTEKSRQYLENILHLYWQGLTEPLYFFPKTSYAFAQGIAKGKNRTAALRSAMDVWEGDDYNKMGEKRDPYNVLCHKNIDLENPLFSGQAEKFFLPALKHRNKYR